MVITGNVLLVAISETVVGWLLTEKGRVSNVAKNKMADQGNSIWTTTSPYRRPKSLCFRVGGKTGMIGPGYITPFIYNTETGDVPDCAHEPRSSGFPWLSFYSTSNCQEYHYLHHHGTPQYNASTEDGWPVLLTTTGKEGWVMDPKGRYRFWVPVEWRTSWDSKNWHHDITMLFIGIMGQPVVMIKF